jgi:hypothetical protein
MDEEHEWSIQQIAKLAGTTSRTLRHYDDIGLLAPSSVGHNGYRYYDQAALVRLQRILLLRELVGALNANSVSGDVAATGSLRKATIDTVSGALLVDSTGDILSVGLNTVSGSTTVRLDEGYPANYVIRSVSGRVQIDGVVRSGNGTGPTTNYNGAVGELSGSFADVRAHSVSGDITVLRRTAAPADTPSSNPAVTAPEDDGQEW